VMVRAGRFGGAPIASAVASLLMTPVDSLAINSTPLQL